ncbi:MAG: hypothetical protein A2784_02520 [Candidatus Chisholmbacteria bacterium RIFCSPHIGHO2_01_FULL_48_12]|uniref:Membrane protein 6-pyruvoyl-tetrahydropterin synthase-related domain-containing protein n=1 Tax=Candidatus Chisholmbacteria bacterium RIFCSPHIGHO2_01_FULL_48_12 TaxID=1797589 RepID=A0A1G1VVG6_9BACT|nr:MAG: hypothetical protein A2784_02520 [Candidatus Chisholmbacteria bacterium RIFCSPHIGHO2_01_FULL_48_12]
MKKLFVIILLVLLTLPAVNALLRPGFFPSHDGEWMVIRLSAFHQALRDGQFPVRWSIRLNHSFGYPVFNFLYPLPFYFGELFYLVSGSLTQAIKLVFIGSFFASAMTMFIWLKSKFSFWPVLAGSLLYIYTPYRFVDTYVRGSVGESLGFVFIPVLFYAVDLLPQKPKAGVILGAFASAATVLSHNVFVIFVILAAIYGWSSLPRPNVKQLCLSLILGAALSAYFWLPALVELKYVYASRLPVANPIDHLASFRQLVLPSWGYGASATGSGAMSMQIGLVNLGLILASLIFLRRNLFLITSLVAIFFMHRLAGPFWSILPGVFVIQFPWRLLSLTTFATAVLAAYLIKKPGVAIFVGSLAILINLSYARPQKFTFLPDTYYATNEDTTTVRSEYLPLWVTQPPTRRIPERAVFVSGEGDITEFKETNTQIHFLVEPVQKEPTAIVKVNQLYYPGWLVTVNGKPVPVDISYNGVMAFTVPKIRSGVLIRWQEPAYRQIVDYLSLITLFALISHSVYHLWRRFFLA